jgi:hypothetical protein
MTRPAKCSAHCCSASRPHPRLAFPRACSAHDSHPPLTLQIGPVPLPLPVCLKLARNSIHTGQLAALIG